MGVMGTLIGKPKQQIKSSRQFTNNTLKEIVLKIRNLDLHVVPAILIWSKTDY